MQHVANLRINLISLYLMQALNISLPVLIVPFLTRKLGLEAFGIYAYAQTYAAILVFLIDFGFVWTATKNIAAFHSDGLQCSTLFSKYVSAQFLIFFVVTAGLLFFVLIGGLITENGQHLIWMIPSLVGNFLTLTWLFHGLQLFKELALFQAIGRFFVLPFLFWIVDGPSDVDVAIFLTSFSNFLSGIICIVWVMSRGLVVYKYPGNSEVYKTLKDGMALFVSRSFIGSYTLMIPVLIDLFAGKEQLALFSIADKFRQVGLAILDPVISAFFPKVAFLYATDHNSARFLAGRLMWVICGVGVLIFFSSVLGAKYGLRLLAGEQFLAAIDMLIIFSFFPLLISLSNLFGVQIMLSNGLNSLFFKLTLMASLVGFLIMVPAIKINGALGGVQSWLVVELIVTVTMAWNLKKLGYLFSAR